MPLVPIASIRVENRFRRQMGDLKPLQDSIQEVGLLHPVVLNADYKLIAGARRLEACKRLGWKEIPARIVNLHDMALRAEFDENVVRLDFLPSEAVALKRALEPIERQSAEQRRLEGVKTGGRGHKKLGGNLTPSLSGKTRDRLANCVGLSASSLRKAEAIVLAGEQAPERYGDLVEQMDKRYRSLSWVYRKLQVRQESEKLRSEPPAMPSGRYSVITLDPPWPYESDNGNGSERELLPYVSMSVEEIMALPVPYLLEDDAIVFLWTTNSRHLHDGFHCLEKWGLQYKTCLTWIKNARSMGSVLRTITEHCLVGTFGKPLIALTTQVNVIYGGVGRTHSRKPESYFRLLDELCPCKPGKKLEMFARNRREGWDAYGLEVDAEEGNKDSRKF